MMRPMGMVLVTALLLVQLSFFPTRSMVFQYFGKDRPWMKLPVATNQKRCCHCCFGDELSWTKSGGWVSEGGSISNGEIEAHLRRLTERAEKTHGLRISLRLRIPAEANAGKLMEAAMAAQRAGVSCLHVAVVQPR